MSKTKDERNAEALGRADDATVLARLQAMVERVNELAGELADRGLVVEHAVEVCVHTDGSKHPVLFIRALAVLTPKNL